MRPLPILAMALTACASLPSGDTSYSALGTEPFWSIAIAGGRMIYETPEASFSVAAPEPTATATGRRYHAERITLEAWRRVCTDGMSDNLYAETVTAVVDGTTLHGCGGGIVPPDMLANSTWSIEQIDDAQVEGERYHIEFTADRISGQAGCNRFSGSYARSGDNLTLGPVAATRVACPGPAMDHERRALEVLSGQVRLAFDEGDALVISGPAGTLQLRRSFHAPYS